VDNHPFVNIEMGEYLADRLVMAGISNVVWSTDDKFTQRHVAAFDS